MLALRGRAFHRCDGLEPILAAAQRPMTLRQDPLSDAKNRARSAKMARFRAWFGQNFALNPYRPRGYYRRVIRSGGQVANPGNATIGTTTEMPSTKRGSGTEATSAPDCAKLRARGSGRTDIGGGR
jgi:hypothetical protein